MLVLWRHPAVLASGVPECASGALSCVGAPNEAPVLAWSCALAFGLQCRCDMKGLEMYNMARVLFGLTLMFTLGCKDDVPSADNGTDACEAPLQAIYMEPGCGAEVRPSCLGGAGACGGYACSCDGKVITACNGWASQRYRYVIKSQTSDTDSCEAK